jgi:signal transduction histidine kinase
MLVILNAAAVLLYAVGVLALVLLLAASISRRQWMLGAMLAALETLYLLGGSAHFLRIVMPEAGFPVLARSGEWAAVCAGLSILSCSLIWSGLARPFAAAAVLGMAAGAFFQPWAAFAACGGLSAAACARAAFTRRTAADKRFFLALSCSLVLPALLFVLPKEPRVAALACFCAVAVLYVATLRQNVFGLLISRRATLVVVLGAVTALYLLLIRFLADTLADAFEAFSSVIEISLILAAAVLWMPLLSWTNRALGRRTVLYTEFGQRVIEGAVSTLTVGDRAEFLANGIRRLLNVESIHISILGQRSLGRSSGRALPPAEEELRAASELMRAGSETFQHRLQARDPAWIRVFAGIPYNYVVPLRYENRLTGILWVDSTPRQYLDDFEPVLLDIARQTSHSLESCRVMEDKIQLERSLMAQRQLAALGNVAASIAHEVKNPLSSIRALTQLMGEDEAFHDKYGRDLGYIIAEIDRLNASMRQLLTFARPTSESVDDVDLSAMVLTIVETVRKEKAGVALEVRDRIAPGLVLHRAGSEGLKQIVWNLLLNAMQAADEHGSVEIVAEPGGRGDIRLSVCDDGPGIPSSIRDRIFEPYFTTRQKGSGLGLSIVEKNVLSLGGSMEVESPAALGRGARFTVILPEDRPEAAS